MARHASPESQFLPQPTCTQERWDTNAGEFAAFPSLFLPSMLVSVLSTDQYTMPYRRPGCGGEILESTIEGIGRMSAEVELLDLSRALLNSIDTGDWATYASMCDASITCFEPEALGHLVEGLPFHKFYFDLPAAATKPAKQSSIASPKVRLIGDAAAVTYVRVVQKLDANGSPLTVAAMETRIWQKTSAGWKHVHFHRTPC